MTTIPDKDLQAALNTALALAFPTTPIAWENVDYAPTIEVLYFQATLLPAEPSVLSLGEAPWQERKGIFQISVFSAAGIGWGVPKGKAAEIVAAFKPRTAFIANGLRVICEKAWPGPALADNGWYHIPVSIRYACYSND
jgi:hypothetical protein